MKFEPKINLNCRGAMNRALGGVSKFAILPEPYK